MQTTLTAAHPPQPPINTAAPNRSLGVGAAFEASRGRREWCGYRPATRWIASILAQGCPRPLRWGINE